MPHSKTQNCNEPLNGMIWNLVLKSTHIGLDIFSVGVYDAIVHFNNGEIAALDIMDYLRLIQVII